MFFSTLTLKYDPQEGHIDDASFQAFARNKEILSVKDHFYLYRELPHLTLCISWRMPEAGGKKSAPSNEAWRSMLKTPRDEELFDRLRRWRADKARKEGVPAYAILTNKQLAEMAAMKPASKAALGQVKGFGPARVDRFGTEILQIAGVK
ncbi:MAG: HRDC domain-containing protein [Planctomycetes bacterium]|nr:HRDC domain-containing protein [Planctomycetota bacterium]